MKFSVFKSNAFLFLQAPYGLEKWGTFTHDPNVKENKLVEIETYIRKASKIPENIPL